MPPPRGSCRSPRAKRSVSYESLAKLRRSGRARFFIFGPGGHFGAKIQKSSKMWHSSNFCLIWTCNTALEASCPKEFNFFDSLRISLKLWILLRKNAQKLFFSYYFQKDGIWTIIIRSGLVIRRWKRLVLRNSNLLTEDISQIL